MDKAWRLFPLKDIADHLDLNLTLFCGQCFAWNYIEGIYAGLIKQHLVQLRPTPEGFEYCFIPEAEDGEQELHRYFQLYVDLAKLYNEWSASDPHFASVSPRLKGLRILRQDPFECTVSFICSQNNNISRITQNIEGIRKTFGTLVADALGRDWYAFPSVKSLSQADESQLKQLGLGYRAKYLVQAVQQIQEKGGEEWLNSLYGQPHDVLRSELTSLMGIGSKVADCISLFSLGRLDCIPVDTHVWQIAQEHYLPSLRKYKAPTTSTYELVKRAFQERFGEYAGWAHSVLFAADLASIGPPTLKRKGEPQTQKKRVKRS
mmetsp:Transcript_32963/g.57872  ORF Transcript_32963/g.57872 Transcript_32963/m.57872 type:complete len:319 (-) Transcript_32963:628-1584(-)